MRILWHADFWDGPLNGLVLYNGRKHWFRINSPDDEESDNHRTFEILYLTDEQIKAEEENMDLFRKHVGTHCDYDEHGTKRALGATRPQSEWRNYYDHVPPIDRNYTKVVKVVSETELRNWNNL